MKVLQVFNDYRTYCGGEGTVVEMIQALLEKHGHTASLFIRSSKGLEHSLLGKVRAFASGIYSRSSYRHMVHTLRKERPDLVHAHNLYPLISPSVLVACRRAAVPVVMTTHNYQLTCPVVNHLHQGRVCERCLGGHEYHCLLQNCRENRAESLAYALRSFTARKLKLFQQNVTLHVVLSAFAKQQLVRQGYDPGRIAVLPNMVPLGPERTTRDAGQYVAYSGRIKDEKGVDVLVAAAAQLPDIPFRIAGDGPLLDALRDRATANVQFVGRLEHGPHGDLLSGGPIPGRSQQMV